ncbi:hypothetical protein [Paraburkholderia sp. BR10954]|uniref:hypothetical protein n=1 Tax=Paraburkholderia sp. BR10954 TaxID=3236995 RepID=UPI0034D17E66
MKIKEGGNGTNRSTVDGRTTKEPLHSPLEILLERYTANSDEGQQSARNFAGLLQRFLTKLARGADFLLGRTLSRPAVPLQQPGATVKLRAARRLHLFRIWTRLHARHPLPPPQAMSGGADMVLI